jgi:hypothetical protein
VAVSLRDLPVTEERLSAGLFRSKRRLQYPLALLQGVFEESGLQKRRGAKKHDPTGIQLFQRAEQYPLALDEISKQPRQKTPSRRRKERPVRLQEPA